MLVRGHLVFASPEDGILFRMIQNNMFKGCHLRNSLSNFELTDFNSKMSPFLISTIRNED